MKKEAVVLTSVRHFERGRGFQQIDSILEALATGSGKNAEHEYKKLLRGCRESAALEDGRKVHAQIDKLGYGSITYLCNLLIQMYIQCGSLHEARATFDKMQSRNVFSWNFIITGYAKNGEHELALNLFQEMDVTPNAFIFASALTACASLGALQEGKRIHSLIKGDDECEKDVVLQNALVTMYAKCGSLIEARQLFEGIAKKNLSSWNSMITAYVQDEEPLEALGLYKRMKSERIQPNAFVFASVLTACATLESVEDGMSIHHDIVTSGLPPDLVVQNSLLNMYGKCGRLEEALDVLKHMKRRDVCTWTSVISAHAQNGRMHEAFELYNEMTRRDNVQPNAATFAGLLTACLAEEDGKRIHEEALSRGLDQSLALQTSLVSMYSRCGNLEAAEDVFWQMESKDLVSWSSMISVYEQSGLPEDAWQLYLQMLLEGIQPNAYTHCSVLQACAASRKLQQGRAVHTQMVETGISFDNALTLALINMYWKSHSLEEAWAVFEQSNSADTMTWTAMIKGFVEEKQAQGALELYQKMKSSNVEPDIVTLAAVIDACASIGNIQECQDIVSSITQDEPCSGVTGTSLVNLYIKWGHLEDARKVFENMRDKNACVWAALMRGYTQHGCYEEAVLLYQEMDLEGLEHTHVTYAAALAACTGHQRLFCKTGKAIHERVNQLGVVSATVEVSIVSMYCRHGNHQEVKLAFDNISTCRNVETWNALMASYSRHSCEMQALRIYKDMLLEGVLPSAITFLVLLGVCSSLKDLKTGRQLHLRAIASGLFSNVVQTALVNMYAKGESWDEAIQVFEDMPEKNVVAWTALIRAYALCGMDSEAVQLYKGMDLEPDDVTFSCIINCCCNLGAVEDGKRVHQQAVAIASDGVLSDFVGTALVNMYTRWSSMTEARNVFDSISRLTATSWSNMMAAYSKHDNFPEVVRLYRIMQLEGVDPDDVTFVTILVSQSQAGLVEDAARYFGSFNSDHFLVYTNKHYRCMVDLLARSGRLDDAEELINSVGNQDKGDDLSWRSLLSACRDQYDTDRGSRAAERVQKLCPGDSVSYVMLSNMYSGDGNGGLCS